MYSQTMTVDADGVAVFRDVPRTRVTFSVRSDGLRAHDKFRIEAAEETVTLAVKPNVEPYGHLSGYAVSEDLSATGRPMRLWFRPRRLSPEFQGKRTVVTDDAGRFDVPFLAENNYWVLAADAANSPENGQLPSQEMLVAAFHMPAGRTLQDARIVMRPAPLLRVRLSSLGNESATQLEDWRLVASEIDSWEFAFRQSPVAMVPVADRYETQIRPGRWGVFATSKSDNPGAWGEQRVQLGEFDLEDSDLDVDLVFEPPEPVDFGVRLMGAAAPAPGSEVEIVPVWRKPPQRGDQNRTQIGPRAQARVDSAGRVTFRDVYPGDAVIRYRACPSDCAAPSSSVGIIVARVKVPEDAGRTIDISTARLTGRLTLNGAPVDNAAGRVEPDMTTESCWSHDTACDFRVADGDFVTPPLAPGPHRLQVWFWNEGESRRNGASHGATAHLVVDPSAPSQTLLELEAQPRELPVKIEFPMQPGRRRTIRLRFCADAACVSPVLNDTYYPRRSARETSAEARDRTRMIAGVADMPPGEWLVDAWSGYEWVRGTPITVPGPPPTIRFTAMLGRVTALVPELYGVRSPLRLTLTPLDGDAAVETTPGCELQPWWQGDNGRVTGGCLPPGTYLARVEALDGRAWERQVRVRPLRPSENRFRERHLVNR